jgi:hypothetical protein
MATEAIEQVPAAGEAAAPKAGSSRNVIMLALAGVITGSVVGLFAVGPMLAKTRNAPSPPKSRRGQVGRRTRARQSRTQSSRLDAVTPVFPKNAVLEVFFPQFVIQ